MFLKNIRGFVNFLKDIISNRELIMEMAKKDFKTRYIGSYLGAIWGFIQPTIYIIIMWFVFMKGFKSPPISNFPFILWLMAGMIPWTFFSDSFSSATNCVLESSYLVKKLVFRVSILPIVKIISALFVHAFFLVVIFVMFYAYGYKPNIYNIQVFYYLFATITLVLGLSWLTSSLVVFVKDVGQIVSVILQFGFWLTPIFWSFDILPRKIYNIMSLNPIYYIVKGYRDSFIYHKWFWEDMRLTIIFWSVNITIFIIGTIVFKKLRPHFSDVL